MTILRRCEQATGVVRGVHLRAALIAVIAASATGLLTTGVACAHVRTQLNFRHGWGGAQVIIRGQAAPSAATPTVSAPLPGPVPTLYTDGGVYGLDASTVKAMGYQEKEFFVSGMADAYSFVGTDGTDGRWQVETVPGSAAAYKTRIVVFTPVDPRRFSGTVVVEWDNVTAGFDQVPDLVYDHDTVFRDGDAYVGVSAQFVGDEYASLNNPARYGSLSNPGDSYSYDIFSQAGMAVWRDYRQVLSGLKPVDVIADGDSQSAQRLVTYIDAFAPLYNVYDGYLIHSRFPAVAALQQAPADVSITVGTAQDTVADGNVGLTNVTPPNNTLSRTDILAPQLTFETQSDVENPPYGIVGYGTTTQADSSGFRLWEVAGTSHLDNCIANLCASDTGTAADAITQFDAMLNPPSEFSAQSVLCSGPVNTGDEDYVYGAALNQLTRWVVTGGTRGGIPASAPPLFAGQSVGETTIPAPELDSLGNIEGGVRSPAVDVPVATLTGNPVNTPFLPCILTGSTTPFSSAELSALYPTHAAFVEKWTADTLRLEREGYLTAPDAANLIKAAEASPVI